MGPISASKAALASLSVALRTELAAWDIPVVLVEPDGSDTPIWEKTDAAARSSLGRTDPARAALYAPHLEAVAAATAAQKLAPAEQAARAILDAVEAPKPKRRYVVGRARMLSVLSRLPAGLQERVVARAFGLAKVSHVAEALR
jgi:NAD(P)-dependent dehydrogenase (short-subunit alcohol dehydrogenase family)